MARVGAGITLSLQPVFLRLSVLQPQPVPVRLSVMRPQPVSVRISVKRPQPVPVRLSVLQPQPVLLSVRLSVSERVHTEFVCLSQQLRVRSAQLAARGIQPQPSVRSLHPPLFSVSRQPFAHLGLSSRVSRRHPHRCISVPYSRKNSSADILSLGVLFSSR